MMPAIIGPLETRGASAGYTAVTIDTALAVLALYGGRTQLAADKLAQQGTPIPVQTLSDWKHHPDGRYDRVCTEIAPRIAERVAAQGEAIVIAAGELEAQLVEQIAQNRSQIKPNELAGALRNVTTTKALNMDKVVNPIRGRPSTITEHRDAHDALESLANRLPPIETTAAEQPQQDTPQRVLSGE